MKKLVLACTLGVSLCAVSALAGEWSGTISDSHCGKAHADASQKSQACVKACVEGKGAAPVFVTGDQVLKINNDSKSKVMGHLGQKVTITGSLDGDTLTVDSVK